jgi:hypothetical protein
MPQARTERKERKEKKRKKKKGSLEESDLFRGLVQSPKH